MLLKKIIMFLLLMPIAAIVGTVLTIIWVAIMQYFLNKFDQEWKIRTENEIRDKLKEYEENIKFLETSLKNKEIIEELKMEIVILKWVLGEIKKI